MELSSSLLFLLLLQTNLIFSAESYCYDNSGNYTPGSPYANNLEAAISSLSTNIGNDGFYNTSFGSGGPDRANAVALCKGDAQLEECRGCIVNRTIELLAQCPSQRQAVWREYGCTLRYSNTTLLGVLDMSVQPNTKLNPDNVTNPTMFMSNLSSLLQNLRNRAASGSARRKLSAGNTTTANGLQYIYATVQCSPDLSSDDCGNCLIRATAEIPSCCNSRTGAVVMYPSCGLRYDTYLFYNQTRLLELDHLPQTPPRAPPPGNSTTKTTIMIVVISIAACVIVAVFVWIFLRKRSKRKPMATHYETIDDRSLKYELSTLRAATKDFSNDNKLGQGGFGAVYKGILLNGQEIAVKRLSQNSGQGDPEFKNEVSLLAKLRHRNLVSLLGFCIEGMEKLLVYEFVENASLDHFIFDPIKRANLEWENRYKIINGIARGILYLHEDSPVRIIHRDLKPSNVLLDGAMNPKIADFGIARLFGQDDTHGNTSKVVGTLGYMSPEYANQGQFSIKSDVFSFGMLVLEIISGKKTFFQVGEAVEGLLSFAWKNWRENTAVNIIDPFLRFGSGSIRDIMRCIHIGLLCVEDNADDRPTMASVVLMLNSHSLRIATPTEPAFVAPGVYDSDTSLLHEKNGKDSEYNKSLSYSSLPNLSDNSSKNGISISNYYTR